MIDTDKPGPCGEPKSTDPDVRFWAALGKKVAYGPAVKIRDGYADKRTYSRTR